MLLIERVVALSGVPIFAELHDHVLADIAQVVDEVVVEPGDVIIEEGHDESWMFVLVQGRARVAIAGVHMSDLEPGAAIGELAALDPQPRTATVTATEPGLLFRIGRAELREVMLEQPELMSSLVTMLVRRLRATNVHRTGVE